MKVFKIKLDLQLQSNGRFAVYLNSESDDSRYHNDVTPDEIDKLVAEEVTTRAEVVRGSQLL